jgi:hypothetical protein
MESKKGRPKIPLIVQCNEDNKLPQKEINFDQVLYWIDLGGTQEEIAGSFRVSVDTLSRRIKEHFDMTFAELKERCSGTAKLAVRRNQFKLSEKNATMSIWLGKLWLGQRDPDKIIDKEQMGSIVDAVLEINERNRNRTSEQSGMETEQPILH